MSLHVFSNQNPDKQEVIVTNTYTDKKSTNIHVDFLLQKKVHYIKMCPYKDEQKNIKNHELHCHFLTLYLKTTTT